MIDNCMKEHFMIVYVMDGCAFSYKRQRLTGVHAAKCSGHSNTDLTYDDGVITLTYTDGDGNCHNQYTRQTQITFLCDYSQSIGEFNVSV